MSLDPESLGNILPEEVKARLASLRQRRPKILTATRTES